MKKVLIVVDMQKDFVNESLGTTEAISIVPNVVRKISNFDGEIFVTMDTHYDDYLDTSEGKKLSVKHCIEGTPGWELDENIYEALKNKKHTIVRKGTFGSVDLPKFISKKYGYEGFSIELVGLCTDICVVSNALILKAFFPEVEITVDASCCAGVTPKKHEAAIETMKSCQINIVE